MSMVSSAFLCIFSLHPVSRGEVLNDFLSHIYHFHFVNIIHVVLTHKMEL